MPDPNVVVYIYDGSVQGKDASQYDIYDIQEGIKGDGTLRVPYLPPAPPFWLVRVWGVAKAQVSFLMDSYEEGNSMKYKRVWQVRTQSVPSNIRNYINSHRFVGFGAAVDNPYPNGSSPTVNAGDFTITWAQASTWLYNKQTRQYASEIPV